MEEKKFKVGDRVVVLNAEAFVDIIVRKPAGGYRAKLLHCGTVLRINEEEGTMELAMDKPTKVKSWWYLVVKIVTYIDDDRVFSHRPLGTTSPVPNINHFGNDIPPRSVSFKGTPNEIPLRTKEEKEYLDSVWDVWPNG